MKNVGFVGLGQMGRWMACHLLKKEFTLTVFDIDDEAVQFVEGCGARAAGSLPELARSSDCIFFCLPDGETVDKVTRGPNGLLEGIRSGAALVDLGTSNYLWTRDFGTSLEGRGLRFADAPVTGMVQRAKEATLTVMFGGDPLLLEELRPALSAFSNRIVLMGPVGSGQIAKALNNVILNANLAVLAEILPLATALGLNPECMVEVINSGSGQSFASETFLPQVLEGRFDHGYPMDHAYKDIATVCELSTTHRLPIPVVRAASTVYQMALGMGLGAEDKGAMVKVFERFSGTKVRAGKST